MSVMSIGAYEVVLHYTKGGETMRTQEEVAAMPGSDIPTDLVSLAEAAEQTGASRNTLRAWANSTPPRITKYLRGGHYVYVSLSEVRREVARMRSIERADGE